VFGGYPLNKITREYIQEWVSRLIGAGKKPSTVPGLGALPDAIRLGRQTTRRNHQP
jgi:hypothetical protein